MKILYHHRTAARDGMSVHIAELVGALRAHGNEVLVVGPAGESGDDGARTEAFADTLRRHLPRAAFELAEVAYNLRAYSRLQSAIETFKPDIIYERYNLFLHAGLWARRRYKLPMILEVNSPLAAERSEHDGLVCKGLARHFEQTLWRRADAVLPVSGVLADMVIKSRGTSAGVQVIPNGVDLASFSATPARDAMRRRLGLADSLVIGFTGFIRDWHGLEWAIDALASLPRNAQLLVVGDGPARERLEARARAANLDTRTHFVGKVDHREMPSYMSAFDIALQPRAVAYASPLKLFEYMALALPIVAPDQPNIREIVRHDESALLFVPESQTEFSGALARLCNDQALRACLGSAARRTIESRPYTWAHNAEEVGAVAERLLAGKTASNAEQQKTLLRQTT